MRNYKWSPLFLLAVTAVLLVLPGCQQAPSSTEDEIPASTEAQGGEAMPASEAAAGDSSPTAAEPAKPETPISLTLEAGTPLRVRTTTTLSTKSVKSGETFVASLEEPLVVGTRVVAPKGADVTGAVVESDSGGRVEGVARLVVRLTEIEAVDGQNIDITSSTYAVRARPTKKEDVKKVGIASGVGAAIGAIAGGGKGAAIGAGVGAGAGTGAVLATKGDPAVIRSESVLGFTLREPVTVKVDD